MMLKPAVYAVELSRDQASQLRPSSSLKVWSRVEHGKLVRVVFRVEPAGYDWRFHALPRLTDGVHEQLERVGS